MNIATPPIRGARFIGERMPRKEDPRLLTGRGTFVDDIVLPGMLHAAFVRSPIARGKILSIDTSIAKDMPGVVAVLTADDIAHFKAVLYSFYMTPSVVFVPPLAQGSVCYVGDPVVIVVAQDRYRAEDAASLVTVDYAEETPVVTISDAKRGALVHPSTDSNVAAVMGLEEDEDLEEAIAGAAHIFTHSITHQRISQSPMETRGVVATTEGADELTLYITCQSPHLVARYTSMTLGLPSTAIRVVAKDVGGSFGLKNHPWREEMAAILAAMLIRRPVKWIEDRLENLTSANQAREQECTLRAGFDADGKLIASHADYSCNNGAYPQGEDANVAVHMFMWAAYKLPAFGFYTRGWYTNTVGLAAYRGPWALESLVRETLLDKAARGMGIDPIELRRRNLVRLVDQPHTTPLGIPLEDITPAECLEKLLGYFDVAAFRKEQAEARKQGRYLGLGIAAYIEPTASAGSIGTMTGELAQVRIEPTGKVTATMSTFSQGHGTQTTMAQVIAEQLGVPYEDVSVFEGDSSRGGFGPGAAGSRQGVIGGGAAIRAGELLADKVRTLAAHLLNANPNDVHLENGMVRIAGAEEMTRSLREIAEIAYGEPTRLPPGMQTGLEAQFRYDPPPMTFTSAAHACIVEIDPEIGFVRILRWISSEDCGVMINPSVVEGQIAGGLAQAIGTVLLEEVSFDAHGNPTAATFKDYLLPAISDVPDFEYVHANTPSQTVGGFRGVGEGGAIIGPPTLVNAIADALSPFGEIAIDLPLTPDKILSVIEGRPLAKHAAEPEPRLPDEPATAAADVAQDPGPSAVLAGVGDVVEELAQPEATATVIDGVWKMVLATPVGPQAMTATLTTDGDSLTGRLDSDQGSQPFEGTVSGNSVKFDLKVDKPMKLTLKYDISFDGDKAAGKVKMGFFGNAKLTGERA